MELMHCVDRSLSFIKHGMAALNMQPKVVTLPTAAIGKK
jgi:hypothetical protein